MSYLPAVDPNDPSSIQFIFDLIGKVLVDTGGRQIKLRFGTSSVTFTASDTSAEVTIPHGLGSTPVVCGGWGAHPANGRITVQESSAATSTNIYLTGYQSAGSAVSITQNIYWMAIG